MNHEDRRQNKNLGATPTLGVLLPRSGGKSKDLLNPLIYFSKSILKVFSRFNSFFSQFLFCVTKKYP